MKILETMEEKTHFEVGASTMGTSSNSGEIKELFKEGGFFISKGQLSMY